MIQIISVTTGIGLIMVLGMKSRQKDMHQLIYGNVLILNNSSSVLRNRKGDPHSSDCYHWQLRVLTNQIRPYGDRKTNGWEEANPRDITNHPFFLLRDRDICKIVLSAFFPFLYVGEFFRDIKEERHL